MERDSFVFYKSFYEAINELDSDADRLACLDAICRYALDGEAPDGKGVAAAMWKMAKPFIDRNNERYSNGLRGGKPTANQTVTKSEPNGNQAVTNTEPTANQTVTKAEPNVNVNENDKKHRGLESSNKNNNKNIKDSRKSISAREEPESPVTVEEVRAYCRERQNGIDPEEFCDFYAAQNWRQNGEPIVDWKAKIRTWERRRSEKKIVPKTRSGKVGFNDFASQHEYDFEELEKTLSFHGTSGRPSDGKAHGAGGLDGG